MQICGFSKTTLLDYPEHVAATVFVGGCNFRCPFCHNAGLVIAPHTFDKITEEEVLAHLKKRRGLLQGVCITGGEPTLQRDLAEFICRVKEFGYLVKLDTNGYLPEVLKALLAENLIDYVAMDIKASPENYALTAGVSNFDLGKISESIEVIKGNKIAYEFRTTVVKGIHTIEEFEEIGKWIAGSRAYYLQSFRESENMLVTSLTGLVKATAQPILSAFTKQEMEQMAALAGRYIDKVELRGVE